MPFFYGETGTQRSLLSSPPIFQSPHPKKEGIFMNEIVIEAIVNLLNKGWRKEDIDNLVGEDVAKIRREKE